MNSVEAGTHGRAKAFILLLIVLAVYVLAVQHFWFVCDDAFISFRYARNLAAGHGLRYNLGDHVPVEGYSNFAWVLVCAGLEYVGFDVTLWAPVLSFISGAVLLWSVWRFSLVRLGLAPPVALATTLVLALFPPFALWSTGGMATMPSALTFFAAFALVTSADRPSLRARFGGAALILILVLLRVDGIVWAAVLAAAGIFVGAAGRREFWRRAAIPACAVVGGLLIYLAWRHAYHGGLIANTVIVKGGLTVSRLAKGGKYAAVFFLTFVTPLAIVLGAVCSAKRWGRLGAAVSGVFIATVGYSILVGGDFMAMGRLLVLGIPFLAISMGCLLQRVWERSGTRRVAILSVTVVAIVLLGALPAWNIHVVPRAARSAFHFRLSTPVFRSEIEQWRNMRRNSERWEVIGRALREHGGAGDSPATLVAGNIGNIGYYSDLFIYDLCGLVSPEVAALPVRQGLSPGHDRAVSPWFFFDRDPTYFYARLVEEPRVAQSVLAHLREWRAPLAEIPYAPDLIRIPTAHSGSPRRALFLCRRLRPGESKGKAWEAFRAKFEEIAGTRLSQ